MEIPSVSLGGRQPATAVAAMDDAMRRFGVFVVRDSALDRSLVTRALDVAGDYFSQPTATKNLDRVDTPPSLKRGYQPLGSEAQSAAAGGPAIPDLSESYCLGPVRDPRIDDEWSVPDVWPAECVGFEAAMTALRTYLDGLAARLLRLAATALGQEPGRFDELLTSPLGGLRANHYPSQRARPGAWRASAHTDYSLFSIVALDGTPGLQVRLGDEWHAVDGSRGDLVVNTGELLTLLSRGRWRSTWHRVGMAAARPDGSVPERTSITFFQYPNAESVIEGLADEHGRACNAGDYLGRKVEQLFATASPGDSPR